LSSGALAAVAALIQAGGHQRPTQLGGAGRDRADREAEDAEGDSGGRVVLAIVPDRRAVAAAVVIARTETGTLLETFRRLIIGQASVRAVRVVAGRSGRQHAKNDDSGKGSDDEFAHGFLP